ncbi:MAG: dihydroorotate dehydrogenase [Chloroflexota bacterium]
MANRLDLSVELAPRNRRGLRLANPVMTASGTCGYGAELADVMDISRLGALVCKGTTFAPREGNPQPRIAETPGGMLNAIGLQNIGVQALVKEKAPAWASWQTPVIVNIAGATVEEYVRIAEALDGVPGVSGIEVNISCPNVKEGGMEFGSHPEAAARVTTEIRKATSLPLLVKLTPNTADIVGVARAVAGAGADALTLINTLAGMAIDIHKRRPLLGNRTGGLSGPALKPVALRMVYAVAAAVDVPIVGCGGIATGEDALEFLMAGASAVQVGTATFLNPHAPIDVLEGIESFMSREKMTRLADLIGLAQPHKEKNG